MKFLADANIEKEIVNSMRGMNIDVKWMLEDKPDAADEDIISIASLENRILVTNDKDFGELVFRQQLLSSGVILLRNKGISVGDKNKIDNSITEGS